VEDAIESLARLTGLQKEDAMMDGWTMTGWGWGWMSVWSLLGIVVIALLVAALLRSATPPADRRAQDSALAVLRRRFAAGEIDEAEFQQRRAKLES
jgi:putative membrane protein